MLLKTEKQCFRRYIRRVSTRFTPIPYIYI